MSDFDTYDFAVGSAVLTNKMQRDARPKQEAILRKNGWREVKPGQWKNPRGIGRIYTFDGAVSIEDIRGTFDRERQAIYNAAHPGRDRDRNHNRARDRRRRLRLAA